VDLHFDVLQEPEKKWLSGSQIPLFDNNGSLSINLTLPFEFNEEKIIWKVFLTPAKDRFPNMLTEVGLNIPFTNETLSQCPYLPLVSNNISNDNIDFILISSLSKNTTNNESFHFEVSYALNSHSKGEISIQFMDEYTNEWVFGLPIVFVENTNHQNKTLVFELNDLYVNFLDYTSIYLDVSLNPFGLDWFHRLAEDRTYQLL
jgi:hypothetical protein